MKALLVRLAGARSGSAVVELGLLAPMMCALLLGVLHVGIAMHSYNALRGIAADVARFSVVQYQTDNELSNGQLEDYARSVAISPPYSLQVDDVEVVIANAGVQRVAGAKELTLTVTYNIDSLLSVIGIEDFDISIERPIFLLDD